MLAFKRVIDQTLVLLNHLIALVDKEKVRAVARDIIVVKACGKFSQVLYFIGSLLIVGDKLAKLF